MYTAADVPCTESKEYPQLARKGARTENWHVPFGHSEMCLHRHIHSRQGRECQFLLRIGIEVKINLQVQFAHKQTQS